MAQWAKVTNGLSQISSLGPTWWRERRPQQVVLGCEYKINKLWFLLKRSIFRPYLQTSGGQRFVHPPVRQFWHIKDKSENRMIHIATSCLPCLRVTFNGSVRCFKSSDGSGFYILTFQVRQSGFCITLSTVNLTRYHVHTATSTSINAWEELRQW